MKKILLILSLCLSTITSQSEPIDELAILATDYVNACHATYYLKMTYCKKIIVQKTTNCLRHGVSLAPKVKQKRLLETIKENLVQFNNDTHEVIDKTFIEALVKSNNNRIQACETVSENLTNHRDDRYYEFRNKLKEIFPKHKK